MIVDSDPPSDVTPMRRRAATRRVCCAPRRSVRAPRSRVAACGSRTADVTNRAEWSGTFTGGGKMDGRVRLWQTGSKKTYQIIPIVQVFPQMKKLSHAYFPPPGNRLINEPPQPTWGGSVLESGGGGGLGHRGKSQTTELSDRQFKNPR